MFSWQTTGSPPSSFRVPYDSFRENLNSPDANDFNGNGASADISIQNIQTDLDYDFLCFFLSSPRVDLYRSIDFRCEDMISGKQVQLLYLSNNLQGYNCIPMAPNTNSNKCLSYNFDQKNKKKQCACSAVVYSFVYVCLSFRLSSFFLDAYCLLTSGADGVLSEARWLLDIGLLPNSNSATRAIGYRQVNSLYG